MLSAKRRIVRTSPGVLADCEIQKTEESDKLRTIVRYYAAIWRKYENSFRGPSAPAEFFGVTFSNL
jgi:hypothetical protein